MKRSPTYFLAILLNVGLLNAQPFRDDATLVDILGMQCNCMPEGYDPVVLIRNDGTAPLAVCTLQVWRNGAFLYNHVFQPTVPLATGQSERVVLPMVAPVSSATQLEYRIISVNGNEDQGANGNILQEVPNFILTEGWTSALEINLFLGSFGPYAWVIRDRFGADVASGGPHAGPFEESINLMQTGCHSLRLEDLSGNSLMDVLYVFQNEGGGGSGTVNGGNLLAFDHFPFLVDRLVTGIAAAPDKGMFKVYPNPATDRLFLDLSSIPQGAFEAEFIDASGRSMHRLSMTAGTDGMPSLDLGALAPGLYTLVIRHEQGLVHRSPVVVQGR